MPPKSKKKKVLMIDKLKADSFTSLKNHDQTRVDVLRFLISLIDKKALQLPPGEMTEEDEVAVLRKELKNKEESKEMFEKGNRDDLVKQLDYEISVVKEYLPAEMGDEELAGIVDQALRQAQGEGRVNFGAVMKTVMTKVAGRVGGDRIAPLVKQKISG
jgi:uncharacterized protein